MVFGKNWCKLVTWLLQLAQLTLQDDVALVVEANSNNMRQFCVTNSTSAVAIIHKDESGMTILHITYMMLIDM